MLIGKRSQSGQLFSLILFLTSIVGGPSAKASASTSTTASKSHFFSPSKTFFFSMAAISSLGPASVGILYSIDVPIT